MIGVLSPNHSVDAMAHKLKKKTLNFVNIGRLTALSANLTALLELETGQPCAEKLAKEHDHKCETFHRNPAGNLKLPLQSSRTDSEIKRYVIEPRNLLIVSLRFGQSQGPRRVRNDDHYPVSVGGRRCNVCPTLF
jgi:hypothetical protein